MGVRFRLSNRRVSCFGLNHALRLCLQHQGYPFQRWHRRRRREAFPRDLPAFGQGRQRSYRRGKEKLASVPTGGAAAGGAAAGGAVAEEAKEEAKASSSEESGDDDMGFG